MAKDALTIMGVTPAKLLMFFLAGLGILLFFMTFIFCGIAGMTTGSEFGAVVNSLLPCAAGVGAISGSSKKKPEDKYDFKDVVKKAFAEMKEYKDDQAA